MSPLLRYLSDETIQAGGEVSQWRLGNPTLQDMWCWEKECDMGRNKDTQRVPGCENIL